MKRRKKDRALQTNDRPAFLVLPANTVPPLHYAIEEESKVQQACSTKQAGLQRQVLVTDSRDFYGCLQVHCSLLEENN